LTFEFGTVPRHPRSIRSDREKIGLRGRNYCKAASNWWPTSSLEESGTSFCRSARVRHVADSALCGTGFVAMAPQPAGLRRDCRPIVACGPSMSFRLSQSDGHIGLPETLISGHADTFVFNPSAIGRASVTDFTHAADLLEISTGSFGGGLMAGAMPTIFTSGHAGADAALWDQIGGNVSDATAVAIHHLPDFHLI
jgi:hypothetical protein